VHKHIIQQQIYFPRTYNEARVKANSFNKTKNPYGTPRTKKTVEMKVEKRFSHNVRIECSIRESSFSYTLNPNIVRKGKAKANLPFHVVSFSTRKKET